MPSPLVRSLPAANPPSHCNECHVQHVRDPRAFWLEPTRRSASRQIPSPHNYLLGWADLCARTETSGQHIATETSQQLY